MTQITVTVDDQEVRTQLERATLAVSRFPAAVIRPEMDTAKKRASGGYPGGGFSGYTVAPPTGSRYRRTGTYGKSFKVLAGANNQYSKSYTLVSNAVQRNRPYTKYVGGLANGSGQARIHARRWPLIAQVISDTIARIQQKAREFFAAQLGRGPGGL